jgi:hypothetical protein
LASLLTAAGATALLVLLMASWTTGGTEAGNGTQVSAYHGEKRGLVDLRPEEVGRIAQQYALERMQSKPSPSEIRLSRPVTQRELANLGIACLSIPTIEKPPLMLVILKGEFDMSDYPGFAGKVNGLHSHVALVYDLWAGRPAYVKVSRNGAHFRMALNDPSLPFTEQGDVRPLDCPESGTPPVLHYGDPLPTAGVNRTDGLEPITTPTALPAPIATQVVPVYAP